MLQRTAVVSSKERESQSAGQVLFGKGGLGYVARRGIDFGTAVNLLTVEGLARMAIQQPLELLSLLPDIVPEVGLALWNSTFLACGPESVRIKAVTRRPDGGSEEAPEGTAAIKELWEKNPDEVGGLIDAFGQNYQMAMFAGMCAAEAVPGNRGKGVKAVYPVNTLTLRFKREDDGSLALYQRQTANPNGLGIYTAGFGGLFLPMPMNRFFYSRLPALPDEPYGRAPMASALTAVLENLGFMRDLLFAWHRVGNPSTDISVDYELLMKLGRDVVGLTDQKEIEAFARAKAQEQQAQYQNKKADDAYFHDVNTKVNTVSATWPSFEKLWSMLRLRLIQALKMLPALMGIMEGDSETWTKVQFDIFVTSIMAVRNVAMSPLVKASQLHLQLSGMPFFAEAEFSQVRNVARLMDAQAEAIEIQNEANKVSQNWQLNNTASQVITGSACPSEQDRAKDTPPKGPLQGTAGTVGTTGAGRGGAPASKQAA